jgi:hypothetical protein
VSTMSIGFFSAFLSHLQRLVLCTVHILLHCDGEAGAFSLEARILLKPVSLSHVLPYDNYHMILNVLRMYVVAFVTITTTTNAVRQLNSPERRYACRKSSSYIALRFSASAGSRTECHQSIISCIASETQRTVLDEGAPHSGQHCVITRAPVYKKSSRVWEQDTDFEFGCIVSLLTHLRPPRTSFPSSRVHTEPYDCLLLVKASANSQRTTVLYCALPRQNIAYNSCAHPLLGRLQAGKSSGHDSLLSHSLML